MLLDERVDAAWRSPASFLGIPVRIGIMERPRISDGAARPMCQYGCEARGLASVAYIGHLWKTIILLRHRRGRRRRRPSAPGRHFSFFISLFSLLSPRSTVRNSSTHSTRHDPLIPPARLGGWREPSRALSAPIPCMTESWRHCESISNHVHPPDNPETFRPMTEPDVETSDTRTGGHRASAATCATFTTTSAASTGSRAPLGLGEAILGASIWLICGFKPRIGAERSTGPYGLALVSAHG